MAEILWIGVGGALGSMARYWVGRVFSHTVFPYGVLVANLSGALVLGFIVGAFGERMDPTLRVAVTVGLLGGYTTFSTWMVDSVELLRAGTPGPAVLNLVVSVAAGLAAASLGVVLGLGLARAQGSL